MRTFALIFISTIAFAGEVPQAVLDAAMKKFPSAASRAFEKETKNGKQQFEVAVVLNDGRKLSAEISADGEVLSEEEQVTFDALPDVVKRAHQASRYGKNAIDGIERETRGEKVTWEIVVRVSGGKKELVYDAQGVPVR